MTPAEIDAALRRIITETGEAAKNPTAREARTVAAAVSLLALVIADQEQRLRALEPCQSERVSVFSGHKWNAGGTCMYCPARLPRCAS